MTRKLLLASALTCIAGGTVLLRPAGGQSRVPTSMSLYGQYCYGNGYTECTRNGYPSMMVCSNGRWVPV